MIIKHLTSDENTIMVSKDVTDGRTVTVEVTIHDNGEGFVRVAYPGKMVRSYPINRVD